jgi:hypothetical protein
MALLANIFLFYFDISIQRTIHAINIFARKQIVHISTNNM